MFVPLDEFIITIKKNKPHWKVRLYSIVSTTCQPDVKMAIFFSPEHKFSVVWLFQFDYFSKRPNPGIPNEKKKKKE